MEQKPLAISTRIMTETDIASGVRLNTSAGWNQTAADWRRFLENSPSGCFVAEVKGEVVGTSATIRYENRFAWIGMVLVHPEFRNRGIGTRLLQEAIEHLDRIGVSTMKLDATPLGKPIYAKLGFVPEYEIERWTLQRPPGIVSTQPMSGMTLDKSQMDRICDLDREVFGADRNFLVRSLHECAPELTCIACRGGELWGYAFGRKGLFADHLCPCVTTVPKIAQELLQSFLQQSSRETIVVDCLPSNSGVLDSLRAVGFAFSRPLTRMVRGPNSHPGKPEAIRAILGPEFG